jgi:ubiquinone/menaquinone biosynthesis C-methylase UbiE
MPNEVMDALTISESDVVADIGAGGGYFTRRFSDRVGPGGRVYASDVQREMIDQLTARDTEAGYDNVEIVLSEFEDPRLPPGCRNLAFSGNVYKEIVNRSAYIVRLRSILKPEGRVAIMGFRPVDGFPGPPEDVRLSREQVIQEIEEAGFQLTESFDFLFRQYLLVFAPGEKS